MTVILNEGALRFLLEDEAGPTGIDLRRRSENITNQVRLNAQRIIEQVPDSAIDFEISTGDVGLQSVIGFAEGGRWSDYLAAKEGREGVIFRPALDIGLDQ